MSNRSHQELRGAIRSQQETIRAARRQQETIGSNRSKQKAIGAKRSLQEPIGAKQGPIREKRRKLQKKRQIYCERQAISSFRSLFGEPWGRWVAFGTLFGAFGPPWSPKVSQRCPEGFQKAFKSEQKISFLKHLWITEIYKKCKKTVPKKHLLETSTFHRKCLQSVTPATLLEVST